MVIAKRSQSCGCLHREKVTAHGMHNTNFYKVWSGIKDRCLNPNNKFYRDYGGRGIQCSAWINFEDFYRDMFDSYARGLSIDRVDVNGNYCKENCKWSTPKEQQRNRRDSNILEYAGKRMHLVDIAQIVGISSGTLHSRIYIQGKSLNEAITV